MTLYQYAKFCEIYRVKKEEYGKTGMAVEETIDECIRRDILKDYLSERRQEVMDIMTALFDEKAIREMRENNIRRESHEEGREEQRYKDVDRVIKGGKYDAKGACDLIGVDYEAYSAYQREKKAAQ